MKKIIISIGIIAGICFSLESSTQASHPFIRIVYDDLTNSYFSISDSSSKSGFGDGSNPGNGDINTNSDNYGTNNPSEN